MRRKLAAAWVVLQLCFFVGWAASEEWRLAPARGASILVRVEPADPRDLLRGQYLQLGYDFSRSWRVYPVGETGDTVWVVLRPEGQYHVFERAEAVRPTRVQPGRVVLRGRIDRWRARFGVEEYFVPEGTETPDPSELTVRLRVGDDGAARIEQVYRLGKPWP